VSWEILVVDFEDEIWLGIADSVDLVKNDGDSDTHAHTWAYYFGGRSYRHRFHNGRHLFSNEASAWGQSDKIGFELDVGAGSLQIFKNGKKQGQCEISSDGVYWPWGLLDSEGDTIEIVRAQWGSLLADAS
jgi:hypothetical protein